MIGRTGCGNDCVSVSMDWALIAMVAEGGGGAAVTDILVRLLSLLINNVLRLQATLLVAMILAH
eukprot:7272974-Ditylum_brightwellii.AAC.1